MHGALRHSIALINRSDTEGDRVRGCVWVGMGRDCEDWSRQSRQARYVGHSGLNADRRGPGGGDYSWG